MDNFEEEVQYFTELVYNNIQEAKKRKNKKALAEETILNCISVSKDGQSIFVYNMDKDYCYELLKKDIEKYNYKNYRTHILRYLLCFFQNLLFVASCIIFIKPSLL